MLRIIRASRGGRVTISFGGKRIEVAEADDLPKVAEFLRSLPSTTFIPASDDMGNNERPGLNDSAESGPTTR